jgi:hypothetical protein
MVSKEHVIYMHPHGVPKMELEWQPGLPIFAEIVANLGSFIGLRDQNSEVP